MQIGTRKWGMQCTLHCKIVLGCTDLPNEQAGLAENFLFPTEDENSSAT